MFDRRVLVVGWRAGIGAALKDLKIPFVVWNKEPLKRTRIDVRVQPYGNTPERSRELAAAFEVDGPFTHVIAGSEESVVAASYARRVLHARKSKHTTVTRCHDKLFMKEALAQHDVPMTPFVDGNTSAPPARILETLGAPMVVKDRKSSGGRGMDLVRTGEEAAKSPLKHRIVERFVDAPEISVESFVANRRVQFENITEYLEKKHVNVVPGALDEDLRRQVLALSRRVIEALRIEWGLTHLELYLPPEGPLFGEIALRPPGGYIMEAIGLAYGIDAWRAFVCIELDLPFDFPTEARKRAAAMVLHPGAGTIREVQGVDAVRAEPHVRRLKIKVKPGDVIDPRVGVGSDVGYALLAAPNRPALLETIARVNEKLVFVKG